MKKLALFFFAFILFFLPSCNQNNNDTIKIGVILPLTGMGAEIGSLSNKSIQLAFKSYNDSRNSNEPRIKIISEDNRLDPKVSISAFQKLVNLDDVKVIIGPISSNATLAIAPLANKNKITIISTGASSNKITNAGDYIFRVELSDKYGGKKQAEIAYDKLKYRKMACVYVNNDYGKGLVSVFNKEFISLGGKIILDEGFEQGSTDFRTILTKIKSLKIDAIFFVFNTEIIQFVKQKYELNIKTKIFTTPVFENQRYLNALGVLANGINFVYYGTYNKNSNDSIVQNFIYRFKKNYNTEPDYYAALAFDASNVIIKALKNINFNMNKFNNELYKIKNFHGITGNISFDKNGDVKKPVILKTVRNGKFVKY